MVIFFGKEDSKDKIYRVKFGGLQEIRDGLIRFVMKHFTISPVASVVHIIIIYPAYMHKG